MISPLPGLTTLKPGSATFPLPGIGAEVVDDAGRTVARGGGYLTLTRPWPAMLRGIYGDPERYRQTYWSRFEGRYFAGDGAKVDEDGYLWLLGRVDDVMNVSGHRVSTTEVESALVDHPSVAEAAVVGANDATTGQVIIAFVTLKHGLEVGDEHAEVLRAHVVEKIGAIARPRVIIFTDDLPEDAFGQDHAAAVEGRRRGSRSRATRPPWPTRGRGRAAPSGHEPVRARNEHRAGAARGTWTWRAAPRPRGRPSSSTSTACSRTRRAVSTIWPASGVTGTPSSPNVGRTPSSRRSRGCSSCSRPSLWWCCSRHGRHACVRRPWRGWRPTGCGYDLLIMRESGDRRPARDFKRVETCRLRTYGFEVRLAVEDDPANLEMFESEGVPCLYVHSGLLRLRPQSRKLPNCRGMSRSCSLRAAITACRSSRFLPVTRT